MLAHLTLTVRNLTPSSRTSIATPRSPRSMLCVVFYTSNVLHNIDKGDRGCLDMKFCIKWASMYMVIRNEVKVMLFLLSAPRIFDQDVGCYQFSRIKNRQWHLVTIGSQFVDNHNKITMKHDRTILSLLDQPLNITHIRYICGCEGNA
jgi:hypothetical protein